jgi:hypothetical protein
MSEPAAAGRVPPQDAADKLTRTGLPVVPARPRRLAVVLVLAVVVDDPQDLDETESGS